jgi:hypothetical protein
VFRDYSDVLYSLGGFTVRSRLRSKVAPYVGRCSEVGSPSVVLRVIALETVPTKTGAGARVGLVGQMTIHQKSKALFLRVNSFVNSNITKTKQAITG